MEWSLSVTDSVNLLWGRSVFWRYLPGLLWIELLMLWLRYSCWFPLSFDVDARIIPFILAIIEFFLLLTFLSFLSYYIQFNVLKWFLSVPPSLTFKNSTWCSLCIECFVRISEQTATFALYIINWLVFITMVESVYCAVWTDSLYKVDYVLSLKG